MNPLDYFKDTLMPKYISYLHLFYLCTEVGILARYQRI